MIRLSRQRRCAVPTTGRWAMGAAVLIAALTVAPATNAHNNPTFREDRIATVALTCSGGTCQDSAPFSLALPDKTVQLVWRVDGKAPDGARFAVMQADARLAEGVTDGEATDRFEGDGLKLVDAEGFDGEISVAVYAKVLDRSVGAKATSASLDTALLKRGKNVYESANCVGCHKWHGDGGGGYGGAALSLRQSALDDEMLRMTVRCGRPNTGMPYHWRDAYKDGDTTCYDMTAAELGDMMPPKAPKSVSDRQLDALVYYLRHAVIGKGEPSLSECKAFWGDTSRMCSTFN